MLLICNLRITYKKIVMKQNKHNEQNNEDKTNNIGQC